MQQLIDSVAQDGQLDHKSTVRPLTLDGQEFLAKVTTFANLAGGLILFGIDKVKASHLKCGTRPNHLSKSRPSFITIGKLFNAQS
jgi:predicted HTH transcriptional regulator